MSEEVETMLSSAIRAAPFATAKTVGVKAHKQVGISQLEEESRREREKQGASSVYL